MAHSIAQQLKVEEGMVFKTLNLYGRVKKENLSVLFVHLLLFSFLPTVVVCVGADQRMRCRVKYNNRVTNKALLCPKRKLDAGL